jgi:serine phosphatase RsbU (regulator of sigma subunit)
MGETKQPAPTGHAAGVTPPGLEIAAASRPYPGETVNGDGWAAHWHDGVCRLVVIDGLGHGAGAAMATAAALRVLEASPTLDPVEAIRRCHGALAGTRGAAISVARIDLVSSKIVYAGVGNVEARLWTPARQQRLIAYRGIVGSASPTVRPFEIALPSASWLFVMHSDGVSTRLDVEAALAPPEVREPQALADAFLTRWARTSDDATVLLARPGTTLSVPNRLNDAA